MSRNVDTRELERFRDRLAKLEKDARAFTEYSAKDLASRLLRAVKLRTPVDTGNLRRNWTVGEITKNGRTFRIEIINPTEYAVYVEYGHRTANHKGWIEGRFMLTKSELWLKGRQGQILNKKLDEWIKEHWND